MLIITALIFWLIVAVLWLDGTDRQPFFLYPFLLFGLFNLVWFNRSLSYCKVFIDGDILRVSRYFKQAVITRNQIQSIQYHGPLRYYSVDLILSEPTDLGKTVCFMPKYWSPPFFSPFASHPIQSQLQNWLDAH